MLAAMRVGARFDSGYDRMCGPLMIDGVDELMHNNTNLKSDEPSQPT
jgi:hypothetical protein